MNCIILGDKFQKGMKSKGCAALIDVSKKTNILQHQCAILRSYFNDIDITYIYGFDSKKFLDFCNDSPMDIGTIFNTHYQLHNQGFSLSLARHLLDNDTLIIDGYTKFSKNIFKKFDKTNGSQVFISSSTVDQDAVGCVINKDNGNIENFSFDLDNGIEQIYYLNRECSLKLSQILENTKYKNCFIFELLNMIIDAGYIIKPKKI